MRYLNCDSRGIRLEYAFGDSDPLLRLPCVSCPALPGNKRKFPRKATIYWRKFLGIHGYIKSPPKKRMLQMTQKNHDRKISYEEVLQKKIAITIAYFAINDTINNVLLKGNGIIPENLFRTWKSLELKLERINEEISYLNRADMEDANSKNPQFQRFNLDVNVFHVLVERLKAMVFAIKPTN